MAPTTSYPKLICEVVRDPLDRLVNAFFYLALGVAAEVAASGGILLAKGEYHNAALVFAFLAAWAALSYGACHLVDRLRGLPGLTADEARSALLFGLYAYPVPAALGYASRSLISAGVHWVAVGTLVIVTICWPPTLYYGLEYDWLQPPGFSDDRQPEVVA